MFLIFLIHRQGKNRLKIKNRKFHDHNHHFPPLVFLRKTNIILTFACSSTPKHQNDIEELYALCNYWQYTDIHI